MLELTITTILVEFSHFARVNPAISCTKPQHGRPQPQTLNLDESTSAATPPPILEQPLPHQQAQRYAGWQVQVEGQLVKVFNNGKAVYLTFSAPHQGETVVRILKANWGNFSQPPGSGYGSAA